MGTKKLVTTWRKSLRYWTQKLNVAIAALPLAYTSLPRAWQDTLPEQWIVVFSVLAGVSFIARNVRQADDDSPTT